LRKTVKQVLFSYENRKNAFAKPFEQKIDVETFKKAWYTEREERGGMLDGRFGICAKVETVTPWMRCAFSYKKISECGGI